MKQRQRGNQGEKMGRMERLAGKMNGSRGITFHRQPNCNEIFPRMKRVIRPRRVVENSVTELGGSCAKRRAPLSSFGCEGWRNVVVKKIDPLSE